MRAGQRLAIAFLLPVALVLLEGLASAEVRKSSATHTSGNSTPKLEGVAARVSAIVASGRLEDLRWPNFSDYRSQLASFYRPSGYTLAWVRDGKPTSQAVELVQILQDGGPFFQPLFDIAHLLSPLSIPILVCVS